MGVKTDFENNKILLYIMEGGDYHKKITSLVKEMASNKRLCYVSLSKTCSSLREDFKKKGINIENVIIIDAISKTIGYKSEKITNCHYISSPAALTELAIKITNVLKEDVDYLIFDSISSMLIYNKHKMVTKFFSSVINKIKKTKTQAAFIVVNIEEHKNTIEQCSMYSDKVIHNANVKGNPPRKKKSLIIQPKKEVKPLIVRPKRSKKRIL